MNANRWYKDGREKRGRNGYEKLDPNKRVPFQYH